MMLFFFLSPLALRQISAVVSEAFRPTAEKDSCAYTQQICERITQKNQRTRVSWAPVDDGNDCNDGNERRVVCGGRVRFFTR